MPREFESLDLTRAERRDILTCVLDSVTPPMALVLLTLSARLDRDHADRVAMTDVTGHATGAARAAALRTARAALRIMSAMHLDGPDHATDRRDMQDIVAAFAPDGDLVDDPLAAAEAWSASRARRIAGDLGASIFIDPAPQPAGTPPAPQPAGTPA